MTIYVIRTFAETRSKSKQLRTWTIDAASEDAALEAAERNHWMVLGKMNWFDRSISASILTIDGETYLHRCRLCDFADADWKVTVRHEVECERSLPAGVTFAARRDEVRARRAS
jgi:hypothetical protein